MNERLHETAKPGIGGGSVRLADRGVNPEQAANLRDRLATFIEDWQRPEMIAYDAY